MYEICFDILQPQYCQDGSNLKYVDSDSFIFSRIAKTELTTGDLRF